MPGTTSQREQALSELRTKNLKDVFELPPELKLLGKPVKIFNVGPMRFLRYMGSYGPWTIMPCDDGQLYSTPVEVPYITNDPVHLDMTQMAHRHDSGRKLAQDIIGVGPFHAPGEDLTRWGIFIAAGDEPTEAEVKEANKKLNRTWDELIMEADSYWNQGPSEYRNVTELHRLAAKKRNQLNKPWARGVLELNKCGICGSPIDPSAAICPHCRTVIDAERVIAAKVPGYEHLWKEKKIGKPGE